MAKRKMERLASLAVTPEYKDVFNRYSAALRALGRPAKQKDVLLRALDIALPQLLADIENLQNTAVQIAEQKQKAVDSAIKNTINN